jgi:D-threo-aldose 1-dehydrogenase
MPLGNIASCHPKSSTLPIGFGCAHLQYTRRSRRSSLRLLEEAFNNGITHFDVARLYSAGEAEGIVGEFARRRRDKLILVSKAGIQPLRETFYHRLDRKLRAIAKTRASAFTGWLRPAVHEPAFGKFSRRDIRSSVETSLRELKTDYLDALLLHECTCRDAHTFNVADTLEQLRAEGKIRAYGIATNIAEAGNIARSLPPLTSIVQIPSADLDSTLWPFLRDTSRLLITHSILEGHLSLVTSRFQASPSLRLKVQSQTNFDLRDPSGIAQLLLSNAIHANPRGKVLFSTSKLEHIKPCVDAAKAVCAQSESSERIAALLSSLIDVRPSGNSSGTATNVDNP